MKRNIRFVLFALACLMPLSLAAQSPAIHPSEHSTFDVSQNTLVTPAGAPPAYTVLYPFTFGANGSLPKAPLLRDEAGNLYGTTTSGGIEASCGISNLHGCGVVFKLDPTGKETVLYTFTGGADGAIPWAGLVRDGVGNLYGTTADGGAFQGGTVFKLDSTGKETILHSFCSLENCADGSAPFAGLIQDEAGNLYGTTISGGGSTEANSGRGGTVFQIDSAGQETVLYSFCSEGGSNCTDGSSPGPLIRDEAGNLYGTTASGGTDDYGTVYRLSPPAQSGGAWTETVLYRFNGGTNGAEIVDGAYPLGGLVRDNEGNLYGTTTSGGDLTGLCFATGCGVVYKLDLAGNLTVLHAFEETDGAFPEAGLLLDAAGNLYGTTFSGGLVEPSCNHSYCGVVFKIDTAGKETVLYSFAGRTVGDDPYASLIQDPAGNIYGTTTYAGDTSCASGLGCGVVFEIKTP
jgi:uncharacterized repeat protein (TIGR03803 family)